MTELLAPVNDVMPTIWYKLRIRLDDAIYNPTTDDKKYKHHTRACSEYFEIVSKYSDKITSGIEVHNKSGGYTYPHIHIHFQSQTKKDTILKKIKRYYQEYYDEPLKGNKMYSFTPETNISQDAFFRYPLKQMTTDPASYDNCKGFERAQLKQLRAVAYAQEMIRWQINDKKDTHAAEQNTIYERIEFKLSKDKPSTALDVILAIQDLYLQENRPVNNVTISGYTLTYCLKNNIISKENNARNILSRLNI